MTHYNILYYTMLCNNDIYIYIYTPCVYKYIYLYIYIYIYVYMYMCIYIYIYIYIYVYIHTRIYTFFLRHGWWRYLGPAVSTNRPEARPCHVFVVQGASLTSALALARVCIVYIYIYIYILLYYIYIYIYIQNLAIFRCIGIAGLCPVRMASLGA